MAEAPGQRILILGCSGSGKSTLALALGPRLGLPVLFLDQMLWLPGWAPRDRAEADGALQAAVAGERWILDGCLRGQLPLAVPAADTVLFLDFGSWRCLLRVLWRIAKSWRRVRPEMAEGCPEQVDWEFFRWIWRWDRTHRPVYLERMAGHPRVLHFHRPQELERWLAELR